MSFRRGGMGRGGGGPGSGPSGRGRGGFGKGFEPRGPREDFGKGFESSPMKSRGPRDDFGPPSYTSDASTVNARVYVGNLPTDNPRFSKILVEEQFGSFGKIIGISVLKGFGFVQYEDEQSASEAIRILNGSEILGYRIEVNRVRMNLKDDDMNSAPPSRFHDDRNSYRERSPLRGRDPDFYDERDRFPQDRDWNRGPAEPPFFPERDHNPPGRPAERGRPYDFDEGPRTVSGSLGREPGPLPIANDVEIMVTVKSPHTCRFAESIENRLRSQGLKVDVLFPHADIPMTRVLADLAVKGTLFAIIITPTNEELGSVTLDILFGSQEEHRNMPVEDAMALLASSFKRYKGGLNDSGKPVDRKVQIGEDAHPSNIQLLVNFLQENRPLTVLEYNRIIKYLEEKRDRQARLELGEDSTALHQGSTPNILTGGSMNPLGLLSTPSVKPAPLDPQAELQQRILNILNSGSLGGVVGTPAPVPAPVPHPDGSSHLGNVASGGVWGSGDVSSTAGAHNLHRNQMPESFGRRF